VNIELLPAPATVFNTYELVVMVIEATYASIDAKSLGDFAVTVISWAMAGV